MKDSVIKAVFAFTHRINDDGTYKVQLSDSLHEADSATKEKQRTATLRKAKKTEAVV